MEVILYVGESKKHLEFFIEFFDSNNIYFEIDRGYLGYTLNVNIHCDNLIQLSGQICRFIFDYYLKEAVISKIYDEYPCFNTDDAAEILTEISEDIVDSPIKDNIKNFIFEKHSFNPESYSLFNLKPIMICIYAITDNICNQMIYKKEKERFVSIVKSFSNLSFNKCASCDVEFSDENKCYVRIDENSPLVVSSDELLSFLTEKSPEDVVIKNAYLNPELSEIVNEIFKNNKK